MEGRVKTHDLVWSEQPSSVSIITVQVIVEDDCYVKNTDTPHTISQCKLLINTESWLTFRV